MNFDEAKRKIFSDPESIGEEILVSIARREKREEELEFLFDVKRIDLAYDELNKWIKFKDIPYLLEVGDWKIHNDKKTNLTIYWCLVTSYNNRSFLFVIGFKKYTSQLVLVEPPKYME